MIIKEGNSFGCITDITDGQSYRQLLEEGEFLSFDNNLSAIMNTDGVNLYSSSRVELWPIFIAINELSPAVRFARENIIIAGIWQGKGKPPFKQFLEKFTGEINQLLENGIEIDGINEPVKMAVICCTMDLLAKASVLNMTQFNGSGACITCEEPGMVVPRGRGHSRCYPYRNMDEKFPSRTSLTVTEAMQNASERNKVKGFKGRSGLMELKLFDLVTSVVPDYMHCVLLGVTKSLMHTWFAAKEHGKEYYIGNKLKQISKRLHNIKPPDSIERLPRDLEKHYSHFKATELQAWLLFYAIPCLINILPDKYLSHFALLSEAIHILLGDYISTESLNRAEAHLTQFYSLFKELYCEGACGLNVHNVGEHFIYYVKHWGPIWAWSCFAFEDTNAMILQSVHGTGIVTKQILRIKAAQFTIRSLSPHNKTACKSWKITKIATNCSIAGCLTVFDFQREPPEVVAKLENYFDLIYTRKASRVLKEGIKFFSSVYNRMQKRICDIVVTKSGQICKVKYFVLCTISDKVYAVVRYLQIKEHPKLKYIGVRHVCNVQFTNEDVDILSVDELDQSLVFVTPFEDENVFVIRPPNRHGRAIFK